MNWLAVAIGGALGSVGRHAVAVLLNAWIGRSVPYATAAVNLIGSLVIGVLAGLIAGGHVRESPTMRVFLFVGILGGFTTFSSLMLDTFTLAQGGRTAGAFGNVMGQVLIGYALAYFGFRLAA